MVLRLSSPVVAAAASPRRAARRSAFVSTMLSNEAIAGIAPRIVARREHVGRSACFYGDRQFPVGAPFDRSRFPFDEHFVVGGAPGELTMAGQSVVTEHHRHKSSPTKRGST